MTTHRAVFEFTEQGEVDLDIDPTYTLDEKEAYVLQEMWDIYPEMKNIMFVEVID